MLGDQGRISERDLSHAKLAVMWGLKFSGLIQNSEVNIVKNVIIIQKANTKSSVGQHGPPTNAKVGAYAAEE
jgi:hypothetical protein